MKGGEVENSIVIESCAQHVDRGGVQISCYFSRWSCRAIFAPSQVELSLPPNASSELAVGFQPGFQQHDSAPHSHWHPLAASFNPQADKTNDSV